jgi:hypothetical protein
MAHKIYHSSRERLPLSHEQSIEMYKQRLASYLGERFDESWWLPQLELSLLGVLSEAGFYMAWFAQHADNAADRMRERATLEWWSGQARRGIKWLSSM